jgi:ABC-2 type transport system permease protein
MTAFLALVRKDMQLFFLDRRSVAMSFIAPIVIASFFAFVFGRPTPKGEAAKIPVGLVNEDTGAIGQAIGKALAQTEGIAIRPMERDPARAAVRTGKIGIVAIVPKGFGDAAGRALFRGEGKPDLEILYDPSRTAERQMVEGILTGKVTEAVSAEMFGGASGASIMDETLRNLENATELPGVRRDTLKQVLEGVRKLQSDAGQGQGGGFSGMTIPFTTRSEAVTARVGQQYDGVAHSFSGMGVQFILFMGIEAGVALLLQRQRGLWKRIRSAPVSRGTLLGSRMASAALCALLMLAVMFLFARVVFGVRIEGSFAGFAMIGLAFALMTATFGLLIAALGRTPEATRPIAVLATLVMVMLGGSWVPTFLFPAWLQQATLAMPTRWAVDGLDAMTWRGLGFDAAVMPSVVLLGFAVAFGVAALSRFRWDAE